MVLLDPGAAGARASAVSVGYLVSRSRTPAWPSRSPTARSRAGEMLVRASRSRLASRVWSAARSMSKPLSTRSCGQQLIGAGIQPVHLPAPGPAGVRDARRHHAGRSSPHRDTGPRRGASPGPAHTPPARRGGPRPPGRAGRSSPAGRSPAPACPAPAGPVQERLQIAPGRSPTARANSRSPASSRTSAKCSLLPTSSPTHTSTCPGCGHLRPFLARAAWSPVREGRPWCARRHPPYESAIKPHVPIRGSRTDRAGGNTPQAIPAAGGNEPYRHRRTSRTRTLLARAHRRR